MNPIRTLAVICLLLIATGVAHAQLDSNFGNGGVVTTDTNSSDRPIGSFLLPDGKILIVNQSFAGMSRYHLIRYNSDGTPDTTFGAGGRREINILQPGLLGGFEKAFRQPDGKILLVGAEDGSGLVARIDENGVVDSSFSDDGIHRPNVDIDSWEYITSVALQPDGKILVGGYISGSLKLYMIRYLANGQLDSSFGTAGIALHSDLVSRPYQIFIQSTGKIVVSPGSQNNTQTSRVIRRFNADGTVDATFSTIDLPTLWAAAIQSDDRILTASTTTASAWAEQVHTDIVLSRYTANGSVDSNFGSAGSTQLDLTSSRCDDTPNGIAILSDGQILLSAVSNAQPNRWTGFRGSMLALARFSAAGSMNGKFLEVDGYSADDALMTVYPDGKILTAYRTRLQGILETNLLLVRVTGIPLRNYRFKGVPFDFAKPLADGFADATIFRPSDSRWWYFGNGDGYAFGLPNDVRVPSDYIKDTGTDLAVYRASEGTWYIARHYYFTGDMLVVRWGLDGDVPAPADYDGDLKSDVSVFRPSDGNWYVKKSSDGSHIITHWGTTGDRPVPGDYDGDQIDDLAVWRPSTGVWYINRSSDGQAYIAPFGIEGDIPVQEDFDGDFKTDIAVFRPATGVWYVWRSSDNGYTIMNFGLSTDVPVPSDYDGDRKIDIAVYRPSESGWYIFNSSTSSVLQFRWGIVGDLPVQRRQ